MFSASPLLEQFRKPELRRINNSEAVIKLGIMDLESMQTFAAMGGALFVKLSKLQEEFTIAVDLSKFSFPNEK